MDLLRIVVAILLPPLGVFDPWQTELLSSDFKRVLLNCSRQSGKSTIAAVLALHRALYRPNSLVLCLAPALRQSQELFGKLGSFYGTLGEPLRAMGRGS